MICCLSTFRDYTVYFATGVCTEMLTGYVVMWSVRRVVKPTQQISVVSMAMSTTQPVDCLRIAARVDLLNLISGIYYQSVCRPTALIVG